LTFSILIDTDFGVGLEE